MHNVTVWGVCEMFVHPRVSGRSVTIYVDFMYLATHKTYVRSSRKLRYMSHGLKKIGIPRQIFVKVINIKISSKSFLLPEFGPSCKFHKRRYMRFFLSCFLVAVSDTWPDTC